MLDFWQRVAAPPQTGPRAIDENESDGADNKDTEDEAQHVSSVRRGCGGACLGAGLSNAVHLSKEVRPQGEVGHERLRDVKASL